MIELDPHSSALYAGALEHFQSGRLVEAEQICTKILATHPKHSESYHLLGGVALRQGKPYLAERLIRKCMRLQRDDTMAHANLGIALESQCKLDKAANEYKRALEIDPGNSMARNLLTAIMGEIQRMDEAINTIETANQAVSIKVTPEERTQSGLVFRRLGMAARLYTHFGYLVMEDLFSKELICELHTYFMNQYADYFVDREFSDAITVGGKRTMISTRLDGPFNNAAFYANPILMQLLTLLLGEDFILSSIGAVVSLPGAEMQHLHRDHPDLFEGEYMNGELPVYAITVGIPLIEMNSINGTTRVLRKTHYTTGEFSDEELGIGIDPVISVGSSLLFDYRLGHGGTPNNSENVRPLIYLIYTRPWFSDSSNYYKQQKLVISDEEYAKIPEAHRKMIRKPKN